MNIDINVELIGLDKVKEKIDELEGKASALRKAAEELNAAVANVGVEIKQPTNGTLEP